jgi:uncharacterized protein with PIN domain
MRALLTPLEQIRRPGVAAALERLLGIGAISDCERCGEPRVIVSEERIAAYPRVFELCSRCTGCGLIFHIRQAFEGPV